jgi:hypothetical protein
VKIVVIGGTGLIGSKTVAILRQRGHEVVVASPNTGVNTITGEGLKQAMAGTQVVIDLANSPSFEDNSVTGFLFPIHEFTPALGVGILACVILLIALFALYKEHLVARGVGFT